MSVELILAILGMIAVLAFAFRGLATSSKRDDISNTVEDSSWGNGASGSGD